jgi:RNA polymerase sigma-70 factor (ECF subfamily)
MVRAIALRRLGDPQEAEEITQTVFTVLARKGPELLRIGSPGAWLHRVAVLECRKAWRSKQKNMKALQRIREHAAHDPGEDWSRLHEEIDEAIDRLPREDREMLVLHYVEGRTFREIAGRLRTTAEASRKRCSRALEKLTAVLRKRGVVVPAAALGCWLGKEFAISSGGLAAPALAKLALAGAARGANTPALLMLTTMKAITGGCFMLGLIAPFYWKAEPGGMSPERAYAAEPAGGASRPPDDAETRRRQSGRFDLEAIRQAFARFDMADDPARGQESALRKLMFALNADELQQVLAALKDVRNKSRFGGIARALFARWAELDGPAAVAVAMTTTDFGKEPLRGAFVTWMVMDESAAVAWLREARPENGYDLGKEWLRWKISTDLAQAALGAERLSEVFPDKKTELCRSVVTEWAVRDAAAAAEWILREPDIALRDDLLGQLVRNYGETGDLQTLAFAASISDPALRNKVLDDTLRWTGVRGGFRMMKDLAATGFNEDWSDENLRKFANGMMVNRPDQLPVLIGMAASDAQRQRIYEGALEGIMWNDPKGAVEAANQVSDAFLETDRGAKAYSEFAKRWFIRDPDAAEQWLGGLEAGPKRELAEAARRTVAAAGNLKKEEAGR